MDAVRRRAVELQPVLAERVVRRAPGDDATRVAPLLDVLAADRLGNHPRGIHRAGGHAEAAARRPPVIAAESDGIRDDRQAARLAPIEEQAHLGNVEDDAVVGTARQHPGGRQDDGRSRPSGSTDRPPGSRRRSRCSRGRRDARRRAACPPVGRGTLGSARSPYRRAGRPDRPRRDTTESSSARRPPRCSRPCPRSRFANAARTATRSARAPHTRRAAPSRARRRAKHVQGTARRGCYDATASASRAASARRHVVHASSASPPRRR